MGRVISGDFFRSLAKLACEHSLPFFRNDVAIDNKAFNGFDPVTVADKEVEKVIRAAIKEAFPDDGLLGEELAGENLDAEYLWVIDPIDGTRSFIAGLPVWGSLVGVAHKGRAIAGMMSQAFTGELFYTVGDGSFYERGSLLKQLRTRRCTKIADAICSTTDPTAYHGANADLLKKLTAQSRLVRYSADCYAFAMLASGFIDIVIEVNLKPYDIMALIPLIEQAGGTICTWDGCRPEKAGNIIAAATPDLLHQAMDLIHN